MGQEPREAAHAVVLSIDEKSQIQALDRTQPGLPMKRGRLATMTHDYKRNGTTTLFAALNLLDGAVIGQNRQRHRHQEIIQFLNAIERQVPADKAIYVLPSETSMPCCPASQPACHVVLDNYAADKHAKVQALAGPPPALDLSLHPYLLLPSAACWPRPFQGSDQRPPGL